VQSAVQAKVAPGTREFLPFAYPPFLALAYAPLSRLDFRLAYGVHTVSMALMVYASILLLAPAFPRIGSKPLVAFVALLAFYPMLRAVGGQTTAASALLLAMTWRCLHDQRDELAGASIGLLLFKPQVALPLICLVSLLRRPRIILGFIGVAALLYTIGAAVSGPAWLGKWWSQVPQFQQATQWVDSHQSIGFLGFAEALIGVGNPVAIGIGASLSAVLSGFLAITWFRARESLNIRMGMTCCALVLIPPHSLFYDGGIAGLGLLVLADERGWESAKLVATLYLSAYLAPLSEAIGFSPLFPLVVALLVLLRFVRVELRR
jgi:hypothetical protein